ncbi:MAG: HEPN domain-containing protein [Dehalococcoidia bacterium]
MRQLTEEWIDKAENDLPVAETLWNSPNPAPFLDAVSFHAQQCVEKYLKAWLAEQQLPFPPTHDLEVLARLCQPQFAELTPLFPGLRFVTSFAVEIRYPGTSATVADAERCPRAARAARQATRAKLGM